MREILFRGKAINRDIGEHRTNYKNGDWVYGLVTRLYDERFENLPAQMTDVNGVSGIEVDYETIGQYTGLTDKNGKKIFEGDIVQIKDFSHGCALNYKQPTSKWAVKWYEDTAKFSIDYMKVLNFNFTKSEVIGNIHDNPELLEGE